MPQAVSSEGSRAPIRSDGEARLIGRTPQSTGERRVSVLIVSHNCVGPLVTCLSSLEAERDTLPIEVIVVDNASDDGTVQAVAERFDWVQLIANRENTGFAHASNQAIDLAANEYLLVLNPDTVLPLGSISAAVHELERHPDVGMLTCKLVRPDGSFDHACKRGFPSVGSAFYYFVGLTRLLPRSPRFAQYTAGHLDRDTTALVDAISGAFMLVRRTAADEVGAMDERYWLYAEDLDWCHRFWEKGWKILYWPDVEVTHIKGASAGDHRSWKLNLAFHRSIWLFYAKHHADRHSTVVSALVWFGIWTKFSISATFNSVRKLRARFRGGTTSRPARSNGVGVT
jgi:GT2 family glycosyltransferase